MTGMDNPKEVTGGIGQALITTASGLIIAIIALLINNILNSKIVQITDELEIYISELEIYKNKVNSPNLNIKVSERIKDIKLKKNKS